MLLAQTSQSEHGVDGQQLDICHLLCQHYDRLTGSASYLESSEIFCSSPWSLLLLHAVEPGNRGGVGRSNPRGQARLLPRLLRLHDMQNVARERTAASWYALLCHGTTLAPHCLIQCTGAVVAGHSCFLCLRSPKLYSLLGCANDDGNVQVRLKNDQEPDERHQPMKVILFHGSFSI